MRTSRVLVVEDEPIVALNLQHRLIKLGYEVPAVFASGEKMLGQLYELQPDLVLMDINIEGALDGIQTASNLPPELNIPVIYLTAYAEEATLERARSTKPYGYLIKPFSERELHATIQMALERREVDILLQENERRLRLALDAAKLGSWEIDAATRNLLCVGAAESIFGFTDAAAIVQWDDLMRQVVVDDRIAVAAALGASITHATHCDIEFRSESPSGELRWLKIQGVVSPARYKFESHKIIGVVQDISERKLSEQSLRQAATVFTASQDGILILDKQLMVLTANHSYCEMTGESVLQVVGKCPQQLTEAYLPPQMLHEIIDTVHVHGAWTGNLQAVRADGFRLPLLANIAAVRDAGDAVAQYVAVFSDLSHIRNAEQQLYHLAHHDSLTGLPNRLLARERLMTAIEHARRQQASIALMFIDLDYFKRVNDTLGHDVGDQLLCIVAQRLQHCVREGDAVARLGGDEFMVMLDNVDRIEQIVNVAEKIFTVLGVPMNLNAHELSVAASIGICMYPADGESCDALLRAADTAMYTAKAQGRNRYEFYTKAMTAAATRYMSLDQDLRRGLIKNELVLHYQPQIAMHSGQIVGVEALIRWQHPVHGLLGAFDIIPIAEESGLIVDIGDWVLRNACEQAQSWREAGLPTVRIAVNVSARQMYKNRLIGVIENIFKETQMPPGQLEIELTESTIQSESACLETLLELHRLGISLAIDDFGTGYSCLASLKNLPVHRVKIDRAFVRDIPHDLDDVAIAEAIIAMAHRLHLQVVAEGVETLAQESLLRAQGCDEVQGYLYAKPMPAAEFAMLLLAQVNGSH